MIAVIIIVAIIVVVALVFMLSYNGLVRLRNSVDSSWSQIGVQLQRRHDLIPNLVETVKGYAAHEKQTLEAVTAARAGAVNAQNQGPAQQAQAENVLTGALRQLFAVSEAYPDLKANTTMMSLMEEMTSTENKVAFARQAYNDSVMSYNTQRETFPTNMIAGMFNFGGAELFVVDKPEEKEAPKVQF